MLNNYCFQNDSLGVFSCRFSTIPTHCFLVHRESIKLDIGELQQFPDLERHRLYKSENTIRLNTDKRIYISFSTNAVQENGDIIFMVNCDFFFNLNSRQVLFFQLRLSCYVQGDTIHFSFLGFFFFFGGGPLVGSLCVCSFVLGFFLYFTKFNSFYFFTKRLLIRCFT